MSLSHLHHRWVAEALHELRTRQHGTHLGVPEHGAQLRIEHGDLQWPRDEGWRDEMLLLLHIQLRYLL